MQDGVYHKGKYLVAKLGDKRTVANREGKGLFGPHYQMIMRHEKGYSCDWIWIKEEGLTLIAPFELMGWNS